MKERIKESTKDVDLQGVLNGYKCISKDGPRPGMSLSLTLDPLQKFKTPRNTERQTIISRDLSNTRQNNLRKSLEPLKLEAETEDWEEKDDKEDKNDKILYSKMSRTGYIPVIPETGFRKKQNQDSSLVLQNFMGINNNYFFGVFDGHGTNGAKVSQFLKDCIPDGIKRVSVVTNFRHTSAQQFLQLWTVAWTSRLWQVGLPRKVRN